MGKLGIGCIIVGFLLGVFHGISSFMGADNMWMNMTLSSFVGEEISETIVNLSSIEALQDLMATIFWELPFFGLLVIIGLILIFISLFVKSH